MTFINRRSFSVLTAFVLVLSMFVLLPEGTVASEAYEYTGDDNIEWYFSIEGSVDGQSEGDAYILGAVNRSGKAVTEVTVPSYVVDEKYGNTHKVTQIKYDGDHGRAVFDQMNGIKRVDLPDTLEKIGDKAFYGCSSLEEAVIPYGVSEIGSSAFHKCTSLKRAVIPSSVRKIGDSAFNTCNALTSLEISTYKSQLTTIGEKAFAYTTSLGSVSLPDSVQSMGWGTFMGSGITGIDIPKSMTEIPMSFVRECPDLRYAVIPEGVVRVGAGAFYDDEQLEYIFIPKSVTVFQKSPAPFGDTVFEDVSENAKIYGYKDTAAEKEAADFGLEFVDVTDMFKNVKYSIRSDYTVSGGKVQYYASLSSGSSTGQALSGIVRGRTVTVTPNDYTVPAGKKLDHYRLENTAVIKFTTESYYSVGKFNLGGLEFKAGDGVIVPDSIVTDMIRYTGKWGKAPEILRVQTTVIPVFIDENTEAEEYMLTVAGSKVTSLNASDILGNGIFRYDNNTRTLTVSGDFTYEGRMIVNEGIDGLKIVCTKPSVLSSTCGVNEQNHTVTVYHDTTVTGSNKLSLRSEKAAVLIINGTFTISNTEIDIDSELYGIRGPYIYHESVDPPKLVINNSTGRIAIHAANEDYGAVQSLLQKVELKNCFITEPRNEEVGKSIYDLDLGTNRYAKTVAFKATGVSFLKGDVNSDGSVDLDDYSDFAKYLARWKGYDEIVNTDAADLDGSGTPDLDDLSILAKCLADWKGYREKYLDPV